LIEGKVNGIIERIEDYGIYLEFDGGKVIVLIPDASKSRIKSLRSVFSIGQELEVYLLKYIDEKKIYKGSLISPS
jgi:ribosomal protein S1